MARNKQVRKDWFWGPLHIIKYPQSDYAKHVMYGVLFDREPGYGGSLDVYIGRRIYVFRRNLSG